ncbi:Gfo/Idh/MocA family oxidoreductase [Chelativorans sp.]|uniref:Gfo/Idh/MocA family protein n=1 Tax=Chelativorans sp. TaxID=2203393 RepID=UPI00281106AE|nr:Gfo/Idh/MocA family oxidoreductase [Chelativorans sp.]
MAEARRRYALVGTGNRGTKMWGRDLLAGWSDFVELVAICETNPLRGERARAIMGSTAPIYADFDHLLAEAKPDLVIVCTPDYTHDDIIVKALDFGCDVIAEKPMTTTPEKIRRIMEAEKRSGRKVDVSFNYRFAPTSAKIKELLSAGAIGTVTSVDFHWYLDTRHGADYFRRWHAYRKNSGSLFVHKSTHHFDLLNWYLDTEPEAVSAFGELRNYGKAGPFRWVRCKTCPYKAECNYYFDLASDPFLDALYEEPSQHDGYFRDACVYREDIDIPDTMTATIRYRNQVTASYSVSTYMPIEGHFIAFNGTMGRLELRQYEDQPWETPPSDEILLIRNFGGGVEHIFVPHQPGGHYGGDDRMRNMIFKPGMEDALKQRADSRAGAMSVLCGVAAMESVRAGRMVRIGDLMPELAG